MKRFTPFIILFLLFGVASAQSSDEEIDYIQAMFGMEKRAQSKNLFRFRTQKKIPSGSIMMNTKPYARCMEKKELSCLISLSKILRA